MLDWNLDDSCRGVDTGVVNEDIELAAEFNRRIDHGLRRLKIGYISLERQNRAGGHLRGDLFQQLLAATGDNNLCALSNKPFGKHGAKSGTSASDQRNLAF